jgi:hypothetical protein
VPGGSVNDVLAVKVKGHQDNVHDGIALPLSLRGRYKFCAWIHPPRDLTFH